MDFEIEKAQFRDDNFYRQHDIEVLKGVEAISLNAETKTVTLSNGNILNYDKVFIATGCKPRKLNVPGSDLKNVVVLRNYEDSK